LVEEWNPCCGHHFVYSFTERGQYCGRQLKTPKNALYSGERSSITDLGVIDLGFAAGLSGLDLIREINAARAKHYPSHPHSQR